MAHEFEEIYKFGVDRMRSTLFQRDTDSVFDRSLWKDIGSKNIFRTLVPTSLGGSERSLNDLILTLKQMGKGSLDIPLGVSTIAQIIAIELLVQFGNDHQKAKYLKKLMDGEMIAAVCNSEAGAGTDVKAIKSSMTVEPNGASALVHIEKRGATNLTYADVVFCSLWRKQQENDPKPSLEVVVLDVAAESQKSFVNGLAGFKTGLTGSLIVKNKIINIDETQLGEKLSGFVILKHCFNLERLLIAAFVAGVLEGLVDEALLFISKKIVGEKFLSEHQYIQDKVISIFTVKAKLQSLIHSIVNSKRTTATTELSRHTKILSVLKVTMLDDTFHGLNSFFEIFGFPAYTLEHYGQKIIRDHMALRFLGGSKEQQKILLFNEIFSEFIAKEQFKVDLNNLMQPTTKSVEKSDEKKSTKIS